MEVLGPVAPAETGDLGPPLGGVPSDEPPLLPPAQSRSQTEGSNKCSPTADRFNYLLLQIQDLHERLREVHEAEVYGRDPSDLSQLDRGTSRHGSYGEKTGSSSSRGPMLSSPTTSRSKRRPSYVVVKGMSVTQPRLESSKSNHVVSQLAEQALLAKNDMDEEIRQENMESTAELECCIAPEWDVGDEELMEIKKKRIPSVTGATGEGQRAKMPGVHIGLSERADNPKCGVIHPESGLKICWDCMAIVALLFDIAVGPVNVYVLDQTSDQVFEILHWAASFFWFLDIIVCFCTAVYVHEKLRYRRRVIARTYLSSWFFFDVLLLLPDVMHLLHLDDFVHQAISGKATGLLRIIRLKRLVRVFRVLRLLRVDRLEPFRKRLELLLPVPSENLRVLFPILRSVLALVLSIHLLASLWFVLGSVEEGWARSEGLHEASFPEQYMRSVEWAVSRLPASSLRQNVELATRAERWLAIMATFASLVASSLFVGILTNVLADLTDKRKKMKQIQESVRKYCGDSHLPLNYTMKVRRFVEREHCRHALRSHMEILQTLPDAMVSELFHEARSRSLSRSHPFLREIGRSNRQMELDLCMKAVTELYPLEHDALFNSHQRGKGMYILASGKFLYLPGGVGRFEGDVSAGGGLRSVHPEVTDSEDLQAVSLRAEEHVSEQSLWIKEWRHCGRLESFAELGRALLLSKQELQSVLNEHSDVFAVVVVYARFFVDTVNAVGKVSDLPLDMSEGMGKNYSQMSSLGLNRETFHAVSVLTPTS